jgi:RimJ/RimL family protein N-acetyltransferase
MQFDTLTVKVPRLKTERLLLRGHRLDDFDAYAAIWGDPAVLRHIGGGKALTGEEIWARVLRSLGHWTALDFGYWLIEERASGGVVGEIGFARFRRDWEPGLAAHLGDMPESGWVLAKSAEGRGIATEAALAIHAWGESQRGWTRTFCCVAEGNDASVRVAEKIGYIETARTTYKGKSQIIMERPASGAKRPKRKERRMNA